MKFKNKNSVHGVPSPDDGSDYGQTPIADDENQINATHVVGDEDTTATDAMPKGRSPILVLMAFGAVLGGETSITRKK